MTTEPCEHDDGIDYGCRHYPVGTTLHAVHRFTCVKCRTEARITDSIEAESDPVNPG